jgi:hypothetical protein
MWISRKGPERELHRAARRKLHPIDSVKRCLQLLGNRRVCQPFGIGSLRCEWRYDVQEDQRGSNKRRAGYLSMIASADRSRRRVRLTALIRGPSGLMLTVFADCLRRRDGKAGNILQKRLSPTIWRTFGDAMSKEPMHKSD